MDSWSWWTPSGLHQDSIRSPSGVHQDSLMDYNGCYLERGPDGLLMDSWWTPDGLQVDSWYSIRSLPGLLMESIRISGSVSRAPIVAGFGSELLKPWLEPKADNKHKWQCLERIFDSKMMSDSCMCICCHNMLQKINCELVNSKILSHIFWIVWLCLLNMSGFSLSIHEWVLSLFDF